MEPLIRIYPKGWQVPLSHGLLGHSFSSAHQLVIHQVSELTRLAAQLMATCDILLQSLPAFPTTSEFGSIPLISPQGAHKYPFSPPHHLHSSKLRPPHSNRPKTYLEAAKRGLQSSKAQIWRPKISATQATSITTSHSQKAPTLSLSDPVPPSKRIKRSSSPKSSLSFSIPSLEGPPFSFSSQSSSSTFSIFSSSSSSSSASSSSSSSRSLHPDRKRALASSSSSSASSSSSSSCSSRSEQKPELRLQPQASLKHSSAPATCHGHHPQIDSEGVDRSRPFCDISYEWLRDADHMSEEAKAYYLNGQSQGMARKVSWLDEHLGEHPHDQDWVARYKKLLQDQWAYISARAAGQKPSVVPSRKQPPVYDGMLPQAFERGVDSSSDILSDCEASDLNEDQ